MIRGGELTVERAVYYVNPRRSPADNDSLRSATVGELEDAGFTVRATPSRHNPDHVSVYYDGEWGDTVAERFDSVLGEPPAGESPHE